jgi:hypothetical protein
VVTPRTILLFALSEAATTISVAAENAGKVIAHYSQDGRITRGYSVRDLRAGLDCARQHWGSPTKSIPWVVPTMAISAVMLALVIVAMARRWACRTALVPGLLVLLVMWVFLTLSRHGIAPPESSR